MATDHQKSLRRRAFKTWGTERQMVIAMEECGELTAAISHFMRERPGSVSELAEEIADMELVCTSLRLLVADYDPDVDRETLVDDFKHSKWNRLESRLEADGG